MSDTAPGSSRPPSPSSPSWIDRLAPFAALVVLVGGVVFLLVRDVGDGIVESSDTTNTVSVSSSTDDLPTPTSPPFVQPAPTSDPTLAPTSAPVTSLSAPVDTQAVLAVPSQADVDAALLTIGDLQGSWTNEEVVEDDICPPNVELDSVVARGAVILQQVSTQPLGIRQIGHQILSFPDVETAARSFDADLAIIGDCIASTIDVDGTQYNATISFAAPADLGIAPLSCNDQAAAYTIELTNEFSSVPYLGQRTVTHRCGLNVTVSSLTTTLDLTELSNPVFVAAVATSDADVAVLTGSS